MSQDQSSPESIHPEPLEARSDVVSDGPLEQGEQGEASGELGAAVPLSTGDQRSDEPLRPVRVRARSTPARRPPSEDEILPQTLLRLFSEAIVAAQPLLKQQSIKALQGTIRLLEGAVERLEAEPAPKAVKTPAPGTAPENVPLSSQSRPDKLTSPFSTATLQKKFRTWQWLQRSWRRQLRQLRDRLPASINRNLSNQALTGAIVGIFVLLLWTTTTLLPNQSQPSNVAKTPPIENVAPLPSPSPSLVPTPTPIPPLVTAPSTPKPVKESSPPPAVLSPSPSLKLTPEQTLIARIQNQVAAISNQYANGLVQSIQANFRSSRLIVHISDGWYGLSRSQQDKLAGELLSRTQNLDFSKLELVDGAGRLLARSPVVGTEMIILNRENASLQAAVPPEDSQKSKELPN